METNGGSSMETDPIRSSHQVEDRENPALEGLREEHRDRPARQRARDAEPRGVAGMDAGSVRNPAHWVPDRDVQALAAVRDAHRDRLLRQHARDAEARLVVGNDDLARDIRIALKEMVPDMDARAAKYLDQMRRRADRLIHLSHVTWDKIDFKPVAPAPMAADGEFWWANTDYWSPPGIGVSWETDGLHFFGTRNYDDDPLWAGSAGALARFELHANRRPPSASGRYASAPAIELFGKITGFTGLWHWLWAADDKWCKCWLNLRQTAYQLTPGTPTVLASASNSISLFEEENNGRAVDAFLPGFRPMPPLQFGLADPGLSIWIDLEVRFDIQMEGWSCISFSPERNPMNSVLLRTFQWKVQPI